VTTSSEPTRGRESDGHLTFEISDDGDGYDVERAPSSGSGLTNMSDRIGALGGTLTVQSTPGVGTTVRGSVPLTRT
jgi:signal transduction histidine kinase